jgi:hypothetical protein
VESLASRFEVLKPHLNERQRRLWLGAEAGELGSGGATVVARAAGVAGDTVRRGRAELSRNSVMVEELGHGGRAGRRAVRTERRSVSRTGSAWPRRSAFAVSAYVARLAAVRSLAAVTVSP